MTTEPTTTGPRQSLAAPLSAPAAVAEATASTEAEPQIGILLVDDEPNVVAGLKRQLYRRFRLHTAYSGQEALQTLAAAGAGVAVVVSDMRMPGMDGLALLKEVQRRRPDVIRVMLTGNADQQTAINAVNDGQVFRFLTKPCPIEHLTATLEAAQRQYQLQQAERQVVEQAEITRQALACERELTAAQRQLVSIISHEFRTPLAVIDGSVELLLGPYAPTPAQTSKRLTQIRDSVRRLTTPVESTLDMARVEDGRLRLTLAETDLGQVIEEVCRSQREAAPGREIVVRRLETPAAIQADRRLLDHVLANLLSNAIKYSPNGAPVEVFGLSETADTALIVVRDGGVGIPEAELPKLSQRFFRASTTLGIPGTGIGLFMVRQIVELHGGSLAIASTVGNGTTVAVRLPVGGPPSRDADSSASRSR